MEKKTKTTEKTCGILGGALSLTIATLIVKILGVIYKIPLAAMLGEEGMGYFNSAYTVYAFFYLLCTAGVPKAVMIIVSEAMTKKPGREYEIANVATRAFGLIGVIVTALFLVLSEPLSGLIGNSGARATMLAIAPSIIFIAIAGVVRGLLNARMRLVEVAVSQIVEGIGKLVLGLIFALVGHRMGLPLELISAFTILGVTVGALIGMIYLLYAAKTKNTGENRRQKISRADKKSILKRIFSISLPITFSAAVMSVTNLIDLSLIMRRLEGLGYSEAEAGALYGNYTTLAVPIFNLAVSIITPISIVFLPVFTKAKVRDDRALLDRSVNSALEMSAMLTAPLLIGVTVYSEELLDMLFGSMDLSVGAPLLCLLIPSIAFLSPLLIINSALESMGRVRTPVIAMLVGSGLKLAVSYVLLGNSDFGISGAPIGTVISYAAALCVSLTVAVSSCDLRPALITTALVPYLLALISVFLSRGLYGLLLQSLPETAALLLTVVACALVYFCSLWLSGRISLSKLSEMSKYTKFS